jgi:predicted amidohydrolase
MKLLLSFFFASLLAAAPAEKWIFEELRRLPAAEARQGVAVDADHFYAISNHAIGKYRRDTGARVSGWECEEGKPFTHLNAGLVIDGLLYCAHSNYPGVPNRSSVEIWDPATLRHVRSIDFGETDGLLSWLDRRGDSWIACFTHYGNRAAMPGRTPSDTWMAEFDANWNERARWKFPPELLTHLGSRGYAISGGAIGPGGFLYVTGHDEPELYVLRFPNNRRELLWIATVPVPAEGQAFSWDRQHPEIAHLVLKRTREIISGRLAMPPAPPHVVTVASLKIIPKAGDKAGNYARFEQFAREAAAGGAQLLVTSECYLDGYLGHKKMHPEMTLEKLVAAAEPVDGPYLRKVAALAKELSVHVLFGFSENRGTTVYNTAALFMPDGRLAGTYSKAHLGNVEWYEPGNEFPVFETTLGKIGVLICFDRQFPETSRLLALKGAQILAIPGHSPQVNRINEDVMLRVRAFENNAFVVWANPFNTLVADPDGEIIAQNGVPGEEGIVYARMDLDQRAAQRGALVDRRPEIYGDLSASRK